MKKSRPKTDANNTSPRRYGFSEREVDPPSSTSRKRPAAFGEEKIPVDSGDANPAATVTVKPNQINHSPERRERKEERSNKPYRLERHERQLADDNYYRERD